MSNFGNPNYSYNETNVQSSFNPNPQADPTSTRLNKSFIDNKPMIQGLVRSVLKV